MNILIIKKRIYLNARERYNIIQKNDKDDKMTRRCVKLNRFFVFSCEIARPLFNKAA